MSVPPYARFRYNRPGFAFAVYPDQIVVTRRAYLKPETIIHPIRSIARVEMKGAPARLQLVLQDGRTFGNRERRLPMHTDEC